VPKDYEDFVEQHIIDLESKKIVEQVKIDEVVHFMAIKLRIKKSGKMGIILDGAQISKYLPRYRVDLPRKQDIIHAVRNSNFACIVDISDMFYNIPIHADSRKYLGFAFKEKTYRFRKAPLGVSTSCEACQVVTSHIARQIHENAQVNIDDFLVHGTTYEQVVERRDKLIRLLISYGLPINYNKSILQPTQELDYLMYRLDFKYHRAYAKNCNLKKADEQIKKLKPGVITNKELQQVIGSVSANAPTTWINEIITPARTEIISGKDVSNMPVKITNAGICSLQLASDLSKTVPFQL
jgi:hypothetical protein